MLFGITYELVRPWILFVDGESILNHGTPETGIWNEPRGPLEIGLDDSKDARAWPDIIGSGCRVNGLYVSERVIRAWREAGVNPEPIWPARVVGPMPKRLSNLLAPLYYNVQGHVGVQVDKAASAYEVRGYSEATGLPIWSALRNRDAPCVLRMESWDGSDLVNTEMGSSIFFCTEKLLEIARAHRHLNFKFLPVDKALNLSNPGIPYLE